MAESLSLSRRQIELMSRWPVAGRLEYRFLDYNPGFSLVAVDPSHKDGSVLVEFHAFHNGTTNARMHFDLNRKNSEQWFSYWVSQFDHIWNAAKPPHSPRSVDGD
jgi:hypothetical protein